MIINRSCLFILACLFFHISTWAQNVIFSAEASATTIGIEDQVQVNFSIKNVSNFRGFQNPSFPDFQVLSGPNNSYMSVNGALTISISYVLAPTRTGSFTIPAINAQDAAGNLYKCNSLTIKVVKGSLAPKRPSRQQDPFADWDPFADDPFGGSDDPFAAMRQQHSRMQQLLQQMMLGQNGPDPRQQNIPEISEKDLGKNIFVKVNVDKTKVNIGEQVTAIYKVYTRIPMQAQISKLPSLNGFWSQDFELPQNPKPQEEVLNGVTYHTFTLKKTALFPQQTGTLILDPAQVMGVAHIADRMNPYGRDVQFKFNSSPVNITVVPLPEDKQPEGFGGAVGKFNIKSALDKTTLTTDESINLCLTISGSGNLKLIEAPALNLPNGLDVFDPAIKDSITGRTTTISGFKTFTYTISPRIPGDFDIPALTFSYFDPVQKQYVSLHTETYKIHVEKGNSYKENQNETLGFKEIRPILKQAYRVHVPSGFWIRSSWYWLLYILPGIGLTLFLIFRKQKEAERANEKLFKKKRANKVALKRLKTAKTLLENNKPGAFFEEISKAIWLYLSDKLNIPLAQLSKESAAESLNNKKIPEALLNKINELIDDCEIALYAQESQSNKMAQTYENAIALIGQLEDYIK